MSIGPADHSSCPVAILAGGKGTRLKSRTGDLPKPMALLNGVPVLEHLVSMCRRQGFTRFLMLTGYGHDAIEAHFGNGAAMGIDISYCQEAEPRGTAGALFDALPFLSDRFFVLYGDTYADVDLGQVLATHVSQRAGATLFLHPNDHPEDSDLVSVNEDGLVTGIHPYPHPEGKLLRNLVNAALYVFDRKAASPALAAVGRADIAKHAIPEMLAAGSRVAAHVSPEYIKDMGTPDRLDRVARDIATGLPTALSGRQPRRAVFLDRDGTINREVGHLASVEALELIPGAGEAIRLLNRNGLLAIVVTNQPVIARGDLDFDGLEAIHARLEILLGREKAYLDGLYFCPHHPDRGFPGERPELKGPCRCRKPATGMIDAAIERFGIAREESWLVGDATTDLVAGRNSGLKTIGVATGQAVADGKYDIAPDHQAKDLREAVSIILSAISKSEHQE